jgi:hypothetical protein
VIEIARVCHDLLASLFALRVRRVRASAAMTSSDFVVVVVVSLEDCVCGHVNISCTRHRTH